jgi:hypothetical protein
MVELRPVNFRVAVSANLVFNAHPYYQALETPDHLHSEFHMFQEFPDSFLEMQTPVSSAPVNKLVHHIPVKRATQEPSI